MTTRKPLEACEMCGKKPKRKGRGSRKGGSFERNVSKQLSLWRTEGSRDNIYWRAISSGGKFTVEEKKGVHSNKRHIGDLTSIDPLGDWLIDYFAFECKRYENLYMEDIVYGPPTPEKPRGLIAFWQKHIALSKAHNKVPIMLVKEDYKPAIVVLEPIVLLEFFRNSEGLKFGNKDIKVFDFDNLSMAIIEHEYFFESISYSEYHEISVSNLKLPREIVAPAYGGVQK